MAKNVLPKVPTTPVKKSTSTKNNRKKFSALAIFFMILLTVVLIILGERLMIDLNDWFNPASASNSAVPVYDCYYEDCVYEDYYQPQKIYSENDYAMYRLLVHGAFVIPVLLAGFLLYFWMYYRMKENPKRLIVWPYFLFSIWMTLHLIGEAFYLLMNRYEKVGLYIVLIILAGVLTWLGLFVQKKWHEKHDNIQSKK